MSSFLSTWGSRFVLTGATLVGGSLGAALNYGQVADTDPFAASPTPRAPETPSSKLSPPAGLSYIPAANASEGITSPEATENDARTSAFDAPHKDNSYEINVLGRQIVGPIVETFASPPGHRLDGVGGYWMTYVYRTQEPRDPMFASRWQRAFYSRKTAVGQYYRKSLPPEYRNRPLTLEDQQYLRMRGAGKRSNGNILLGLPYAARLAVNTVALSEMHDDGTNGLGTAERGVVIADTAMVSSHVTDYALYAYGLRQISRGNELGATRTLSLYNRVNILSNALSIVTGGLRLYAETIREERTGKNNPTSFFFSFMDMAMGGIGIIFSAYMLRHLRNTRRRFEEEGKSLCAEKANNILLGIFNVPKLIQNSMRASGALGASAALGVNASNLIFTARHPDMNDALAQSTQISSSLGLVGSAFALGAAYLMTPAAYPISRKFMVGASVFISVQTIHDFWPMIVQLMGL